MNKLRMSSKFLAVLLAACLVSGLIPVSALGLGYDYSSGTHWYSSKEDGLVGSRYGSTEPFFSGGKFHDDSGIIKSRMIT